MGFASRAARKAAPLSVLLLGISCGQGTAPVTPDLNSPPRNQAFVPAGPSGVLVGAGDIGFCGMAGSAATASLLDKIPGTVFTAGDNAYPSGSREDFQNCYAPSWGRHLSRTRPAVGNHDFDNTAGSPYFEYFGANAGLAGPGYYSYAVGPWNVIALNSEIPSGPGSAQMLWLRNELSTKRPACTAVYWHRPLYSSGRHGNNPDMRGLWRTLYEFDVDLVIGGHDHIYERFAPQDPDGRYDAARGIREFVVGTGGAPLYDFRSSEPNSEIRASVWGVTAFTLNADGYRWEFVPVDGQTFRDAGSAACH